LTAPPEHFYKYYDQDLPLPKLYTRSERPKHPYLVDYRHSFNYDDYFDEVKLKKALAGYYGLCSFLDQNIGLVLKALADAGLADDTRVLYTSDHGDNLGTRGMWGKSTMYEETAGVPLIMAGPEIPVGRVIETTTSHVDVYPFILEAVGAAEPSMLEGFPGVSLNALAEGEKPNRNVLVEYHGMGSSTAAFMIRHQQYKYVYYVDYPPQLFDLQADPEELNDLAAEPAYAAVLKDCHQRLTVICDPIAVDRQVRQRQAKLLAANGGRDAVIKRGDLGFSPAPGAALVFD
jgi:choline-sulfatase